MACDNSVFDIKTEILRKIVDKIVAIVLGLKPDQIVRQHRLDQFAMMRHATNHGARGPWRMQEEADRLLDAEIAQLRAEREEMIILNPERGLRLLEPEQGLGHECVHFAIGKIVILRGADQIAARMQRRPQRRIGKPLIIAAVMRGRQIEHGQRTGSEGLDFGKRLLLRTIANAAAGTDPNRTGFFHYRQ